MFDSSVTGTYGNQSISKPEEKNTIKINMRGGGRKRRRKEKEEEEGQFQLASMNHCTSEIEC